MSDELDKALILLPAFLRNELIGEFRDIQASYYARAWSPAALSGGRFCEVVYSVISGYDGSVYPTRAAKPRNFLVACQKLENETALPRSFRILIPRMLPALYEVRNNRGIGHVGGDVDPSYMDSSLVLAMASWILAEIVRVLYSTTLEEAQRIVSQLSCHQAPAVWVSATSRRVLNPSLKLEEQILLLVGSVEGSSELSELTQWVESSRPAYVKRVLKDMHKKRLVEFSKENQVELLPPGMKLLSSLLTKEKSKGM